MKYLVVCVSMFVMFVCVGNCFGSESGIQESPVVIHNKITTSSPPSVVPKSGSSIFGSTSIQSWPNIPPVPVTPPPVNNFQPPEPPPAMATAPCSTCTTNACAYGPYQVRVEYTPIEPQPFTQEFCSCLPYGCPDGLPVVTSCGVPGILPCTPTCVEQAPVSTSTGSVGIFTAVVKEAVALPLNIIGDASLLVAGVTYGTASAVVTLCGSHF